MMSSVSTCFTVSLLLLFWLLLSNFHLFSKCKAKRLLLGGVWLWTWTLFNKCCPSLRGDLFVNEHYLTSASRSVSPLPIATEQLRAWEWLTLQCVEPSAWETSDAEAHPPGCVRVGTSHQLGFEKFIWLLLGSDERTSPLGLVVRLVGNFTFAEMEVAILDWWTMFSKVGGIGFSGFIFYLLALILLSVVKELANTMCCVGMWHISGCIDDDKFSELFFSLPLHHVFCFSKLYCNPQWLRGIKYMQLTIHSTWCSILPSSGGNLGENAFKI